MQLTEEFRTLQVGLDSIRVIRADRARGRRGDVLILGVMMS
jgi:aryl carrier-like protein